jgi:starch synthase
MDEGRTKKNRIVRRLSKRSERSSLIPRVVSFILSASAVKSLYEFIEIMKILFAASEAVPFAKTGGLADVAGSLPPALAALGHDVRVVMPLYRSVDRKRSGLKRVATFYVPLGSWQERCDVLQGRMGKGVTVYFVGKDIYYDRPELYRTAQADYPDNAERFTYFSRAALELCRAMDFYPEIVHCNDWQTGLVPFFLKTLYRNTASFERTKSVFTIHNLGYQGLFSQEAMRYLGIGWEYFTPEGIEYWGKVGFLKAGLVYSDVITTVSKTYSREVQTKEYGLGLDGVLAKRAGDLYGIVNGIDSAEWDPGRDASIAKRYTAARPAGKAACKQKLLKAVGMPARDAPLVGMVTRLAAQKGLDLVVEALPELMSLGIQLVVLGTGEEQYQRILAEAAARYPRQMFVLLGYDDRLAKRIYAGCDLFLMPSQYEPCGLGQLIALRYGTVPAVRRTGGLADTVQDYVPKTGRGTGFVFNGYTAQALVECLRGAVSLYGNSIKWKRLMQSGMKQDFSWKRSAAEYVKVYRKAMRK